MKSVKYSIIISFFLALLTVTVFSSLQSEFSILALFPGFWLNWATEQILIEILREPYFSLDNMDAFFDLSAFGESGKNFLLLIAKDLSLIFNFIFYFIIFFAIVLIRQFSTKILKENIS